MARASADKAYRTFQNGFVTEATGLTFPENSLRDVDNCDIEVKGQIRRRLGLLHEANGVVVGEGALDNQTYANNTGGPLSANPYTPAEDIESTYDGTAASDWTLATSGGNSEALVSGGTFRLGSTKGNYGYMQQDVDFTSYDRITLRWESEENTENEPDLSIGLGVTSGGLGQGLVVRREGLFKATFSARDYTGVTQELLWDGAGSNYELGRRVEVVLTPLAPGSWLASIVTMDRTTGAVLNVTQTTLAIAAAYIEFRVASGQTHFGRYLIDNIYIRRESFENQGDLGFETVSSRDLALSEHLWLNAGGIDGKNWVVFQIGNRLYFRDHDRDAVSPEGGSVPAGATRLDFDGPGTGFIYNVTAADAAKVKLQSATGNGRLWFTSAATIPFFAEYDAVADSIILRPNGYEANDRTKSLTGQRLIRDFNGIEDGQTNDERLAALTQEHAYNLLNQGWNSTEINTYFTADGVYPSNAQQWILGKDANDDFDPALLDKQDFGNSRAPRGRFTLDALLGTRDGVVHAITGLTNPLSFDGAQEEQSPTGWTTVGFFAGRVWYTGDTNLKRANGVYFSRTLQSSRDSGIFMQENDPTSEHFSDLLATDGGVIYIPEAERILRLIAFGAGILVVATNGIWMIYGGEGGFTATNFSVEKVSATGIISADTAVVTDQSVVFWADNGVHVLALPERGIIPVVQDVSQTRIFEYYNAIPLVARRRSVGNFDRITKKVVWLWQESDRTDPGNLFNRALIFDTRTGAYTKHSFAMDFFGGSGIAGLFPRSTPTAAKLTQVVTTTAGVTVTTTTGEVVTALTSSDTGTLQLSMKLVVLDAVDLGLRLGDLASRLFEDFEGFPNFTAEDYTSYLITGDETLGDLQRAKQATYIHSFFRRTEVGFLDDGAGNLVANSPSGCTLIGAWDWHTSASGNRWSNSQPAYRYRRPYAPADSGDNFDTGEEIVYTKVKVRGKGRALSLRYTSVSGKDFQLLGFSIPFTAAGA